MVSSEASLHLSGTVQLTAGFGPWRPPVTCSLFEKPGTGVGVSTTPLSQVRRVEAGTATASPSEFGTG